MKPEEHINLKVAWYYPSSEEVFSNIIKIWVQSMVFANTTGENHRVSNSVFKVKDASMKGSMTKVYSLIWEIDLLLIDWSA